MIQINGDLCHKNITKNLRPRKTIIPFVRSFRKGITIICLRVIWNLQAKRLW